uniref:E3 ubiquitin-protein ligase trim8 n=1 Tax=Sphaerodactylus townsendi TaxID=933632 RepID=A0ACB8F9Z4_9SAUR
MEEIRKAQKMLVKQQDRLEEREQDIEQQLYKLESDKRLVEEKVNQLKDEVRLQYEKMHQILDEDLRKTMEILDKAQAKFCNENAAQVLHLSERMQEAKKLLSSVQVMYDKTEDINFMKVTLCGLPIHYHLQSSLGHFHPYFPYGAQADDHSLL